MDWIRIFSWRQITQSFVSDSGLRSSTLPSWRLERKAVRRRERFERNDFPSKTNLAYHRSRRRSIPMWSENCAQAAPSLSLSRSIDSAVLVSHLNSSIRRTGWRNHDLQLSKFKAVFEAEVEGTKNAIRFSIPN